MENKEIALGLFVLVSIFYAGFSLANFENPYQTTESCEEQIYNNTILTQDYIVRTILEIAVSCEQVPIPYGNETYNLVWIDCLNAGTSE